MPDSIRARLTLWYAVGLTVLLAGFAIASYVLLARSAQRRIDEGLRQTARAFAADWIADQADRATAGIGTVSAVRGIDTGDLEIIVYDRARRVVAARQHEIGWIPRGIRVGTTPELSALLGQLARANGDFATLSGDGAPKRAFVLPIGTPGRGLSIAVMQGLDGYEAQLRHARDAYLVAIPIALLLALAGGYALAGRALAPVGTMAAQAQRIGAFTPHERLRTRNDSDELGRLAHAFNGLLDRLNIAFEQQRQFLAEASHELRTPVAVVRGEAELALSRDDRSPSEYRDALEVIHAEGRRMSRIVDDLLLLSRADAGRYPLSLEELYLDELVAECVRAMRTVADARDVTLQYEAAAELPFRGDDALLRRLVINLLDNAIKYGPGRSVVAVRAYREESGAYVVSVRDRGTGIPREVQDRLFERFYRARGAPGGADREGDSGAGLGLAIGRWIAEAHGGSLELFSSGAQGTEFRISMPAPSTQGGDRTASD